MQGNCFKRQVFSKDLFSNFAGNENFSFSVCFISFKAVFRYVKTSDLFCVLAELFSWPMWSTVHVTLYPTVCCLLSVLLSHINIATPVLSLLAFAGYFLDRLLFLIPLISF